MQVKVWEEGRGQSQLWAICLLTNPGLSSSSNTVKTICAQLSSEASISCGIEVPREQYLFKLFPIVDLEPCTIVHPRNDVLPLVLFDWIQKLKQLLREGKPCAFLGECLSCHVFKFVSNWSEVWKSLANTCWWLLYPHCYSCGTNDSSGYLQWWCLGKVGVTILYFEVCWLKLLLMMRCGFRNLMDWFRAEEACFCSR